MVWRFFEINKSLKCDASPPIKCWPSKPFWIISLKVNNKLGISFFKISSVHLKKTSKSSTFKFSDTAFSVNFLPQKLTTRSKVDNASRIAPSDF